MVFRIEAVRWQEVRFWSVGRKHLINICRNSGQNLFQRGGTAKVMERFANFGDEMMEGHKRWNSSRVSGVVGL